MITETSTRRIEPDITVFAISGRLNLGNSLISTENAIRKLADDGARKLIVDLTSLSFIDSSGIGMLVSCCGHMEQRGGRIRIAGVQGPVAKVLGLVHLDRLVSLDADVESASRQLAAEAAGA